MVKFLTVFIQVIAGNVVSTIAVVVADEALPSACIGTSLNGTARDPAPRMPSLITRIHSDCGPLGTGLQTRSV